MTINEIEKLQVKVDEDGLVGFNGYDFFNPKSLRVVSQCLINAYNEICTKYNYYFNWLEIANSIYFYSSHISFSILPIVLYLYRLDKKNVDIKPILKSMDENHKNAETLFHDFSVIKNAYAYSKIGCKVKFGYDSEKVDLIINDVRVEVKREMGFIKNKKFKTGKADELFIQKIRSRSLRKKIKKAFEEQKAETMIIDVTSDIGELGIIFLFKSNILKTIPPEVKNESIILFCSLEYDVLEFLYFSL